ncbi:MAG: DUF2971 domain-containing protein [Roseibium sp.]
MKPKRLPSRIFKYRAFSSRALDMLVGDQLYFADPRDFNDPLDSKPTLDADVSNDDLEEILSRLVEQRIKLEMNTAASSLMYRGPKTVDHIFRHTQKRVDSLLSEIRYNADNPFYDSEDPLRLLFTQYLEDELLRRYDGGIVSFGERVTCPVMWSHYGDQHRGLCAGYSISSAKNANLNKIAYKGSRNVKASDVAVMDTDPAAKRRVDEAVLLRKARSWSYEKEWRLIGQRGAQDSPLKLEEVVFGIRCSSVVKYTVAKALENRPRPVQFYEMCEKYGTFQLSRRRLDIDELNVGMPRDTLSLLEAFDGLNIDEPPK